MNLSYRGARYNTSANNVTTAETGVKAQFRGNEYTIRQPLQPASRANASLTYRGVAY